jgi:hypothetical protein
MKRFFSAQPLQHFSKLPKTIYEGTRELVTVDHMHGVAALNSLLLSVSIKADVPRVQCSVPSRWNVFHSSGSWGTIPLVLEDGTWRIDAHKE